MIDSLEQLKTIALTALFNPAFLGFLVILFFVGRIFGKLTRNIHLWKILVLGYFALFLYAPVRDAGPIIGGVFLLGIASNHVGTFVAALSWAGSLGDLFFALRYRSAFDDIRHREQELEERERQLKDSERRQAYQQREQDEKARSGWQQEARGFRGKAKEKQERGSSSSGQKNRRSQRSQNQSGTKKQRSYSPPPQNDVRSNYLRTLGLDPDKEYSAEQIKKAYRRKVKQVHPDVGGSHAELIAVTEAFEWLKRG